MDGMQGIELSESMQQILNDVFVWIGFGTVVGLLAKAIMPGRDPGGAIATLLMGIAGSVIGCGTVSFFYSSQRITPISPLGMLVAVAGAFLILFFYRMLGGYFFYEDQAIPQPNLLRRRPSRPRRYSASTYDDRVG